MSKDKKYSSLSLKLELKGLVKPETASSTHSTLHLSRCTKPILFKKLFASTTCIRQIYKCYPLDRYILCVVGVVVCNEHWEQGIQIELTCNSKLFSL